MLQLQKSAEATLKSDRFRQVFSKRIAVGVSMYDTAVALMLFGTLARLNIYSCIAADKKVSIINVANWSSIQLLDVGHSHGLNDCAWLAENLIVTASDDHTVRVFDIEQVV